MHLTLCLVLALTCTSCVLGEKPPPETIPLLPSATEAEVELLRQDVAKLREAVHALEGRAESIEPWLSRIATIESLLAQKQKPAKKGQRMNQERQTTPLQLVTLAQTDARIYPDGRGFYGKSAEQVYTYQPGRVYIVYLTPVHATGIFLTPGEQIAVGLMLDKDQYTVISEVVGREPVAYSALSVHPKIDKGECDAFVVTESGSRYLFHFVVGTKGMTAVTFERPAVLQAVSTEPKLVLPRPHP